VSDLVRDADIRAVTRCLLFTERAVVRLRSRFPSGTACSSCGVTHPAALVAGSRPAKCYACRVGRATEGNHVAGSGRGPLLELLSNAHRVFSEIEALRNRFALALGLTIGYPIGRVSGGRRAVLDEAREIVTARARTLGSEGAREQ
jgi:hypothetical protein